MSGLLEELWAPAGPRRLEGRLLLPFLRLAEGCFRLGVRGRRSLYRFGWARVERAPIPVLSIGGIEAGGVGKTPLAVELMRLAAREGLRPAILSRGYGSRARKGARRVPSTAPEGAAEQYGDEPVWMAEQVQELGGAGVWVAARRIDAARCAAEAGAGLAILDDGFQHWALARDLEVVSLSGREPFGNGRLLPAGPLRESPAGALLRADRVVLAGIEPEELARVSHSVRPYLRPEAEIFSWRGRPSLQPVIGDPPSSGEPVRLMAGIAHPERLAPSLARIGHPVAGAHLFPDHHRFDRQEIARLLSLAPSPGGIPWVVTEKDWVRLAPVLGAALAQTKTAVPLRLALLRQALVWNEPGAERSWTMWMRASCLPSSRN